MDKLLSDINQIINRKDVVAKIIAKKYEQSNDIPIVNLKWTQNSCYFDSIIQIFIPMMRQIGITHTLNESKFMRRIKSIIMEKDYEYKSKLKEAFNIEILKEIEIYDDNGNILTYGQMCPVVLTMDRLLEMIDEFQILSKIKVIRQCKPNIMQTNIVKYYINEMKLKKFNDVQHNIIFYLLSKCVCIIKANELVYDKNTKIEMPTFIHIQDSIINEESKYMYVNQTINIGKCKYSTSGIIVSSGLHASVYVNINDKWYYFDSMIKEVLIYEQHDIFENGIIKKDFHNKHSYIRLIQYKLVNSGITELQYSNIIKNAIELNILEFVEMYTTNNKDKQSKLIDKYNIRFNIF